MAEEWRDVTQLLAGAAEELKVGELLSEGQIDLHEGMTAVKIGDPKMDTGVGLDGIVTLRAAKSANLFPTNLDACQVRDVLRALLVNEVCWFRGMALIQTMQRCLYLHDLANEAIPLPIRAYGLLLACTIRSASELIDTSRVCHDEDFAGCGSAANMSDVPVPAVLALVDKACEELAEAAERHKGSEEGRAARESRDLLLHRKAFAGALKEVQDPNSQLHQGTLEPMRRGLAETQAMLQHLRGSLDDVPFNAPVPGFDGRVCRIKVSMALPQPPEMPSTHKALDELLETLAQAQLSCTVKKYKTLPALRAFLFDFALKQPNVLARAWLHKVFSGVMSDGALSAMIVADMGHHGIPRSVTSSQQGQRVVGHVVEEEREVCRFLLQNLSRQWQRMDKLLQGWDSAMLLAANLDIELYGSPVGNPAALQPLSTYVIVVSLPLMLHYIRLGFALDLYQGLDTCAACWYMDYLSSVCYQVVRYLLDCNFELGGGEVGASSGGGGGGKKKSKKKGKPKKEKAEPSHSLAASHTVRVLQAQSALCRGIWKFVGALQHSSLYEDPASPFGSFERRFNERFPAFRCIAQPAIVPYSRFNEDYSQDADTPLTWFANAGACFQDACSRFQELVEWAKDEPSSPALPLLQADLDACLKVAKANSVSLRLVFQVRVENQEGKKPAAKGAKAGKQSKPVYDRTKHFAFPVVKFL